MNCNWCASLHIYINLRRSRDCLWVSVRRGVRPSVTVWLEVCVTNQLRAASFTYFGEVLRRVYTQYAVRTQTELRKQIYADTRVMAFILCHELSGETNRTSKRNRGDTRNKEYMEAIKEQTQNGK